MKDAVPAPCWTHKGRHKQARAYSTSSTAACIARASRRGSVDAVTQGGDKAPLGDQLSHSVELRHVLSLAQGKGDLLCVLPHDLEVCPVKKSLLGLLRAVHGEQQLNPSMRCSRATYLPFLVCSLASYDLPHLLSSKLRRSSPVMLWLSISLQRSVCTTWPHVQWQAKSPVMLLPTTY